MRVSGGPGLRSASGGGKPPNRLEEAGGIGTVEMWSPDTGQRLAPPLLADSAPITSLGFDPSGRRFAITGYGDGSVKVWFTAGLQQEGPGRRVRLAGRAGGVGAARVRGGRPQPHPGRVGALRGRPAVRVGLSVS